MTRDEIRAARAFCGTCFSASSCTVALDCDDCDYKRALAALERVLDLADLLDGGEGLRRINNPDDVHTAAAIRRAVEGK